MKCFENVGAFTHEEQRSERHFYMPAKQFLALDLFCAGIGNAVFRVPAFHKQASKPTASASTFRLTRPAGGDPKTSAHLTNIKGETTMKFNTAFRSADILLPADANMTKWAVVACDQYTSEPEYWARAEEVVGDAPSALRLVLPEIYLEQEGVEARIAKINENIDSYLANGIFKEYKNALVYLERVQADGKLRQGLVGAIDLEEYDYHKGSTSRVRATEATVPERIPPRLKIRENAGAELPHIMILIDDELKTVIEPLKGNCPEKLYDFELMLGGGVARGYLVPEELHAQIDSALLKLSDKCDMLYAMGDGNHSLATAKEHYEKLKRENPDKDLSNHPARYALCEVVNLHSEALEFEAIHRIVTEVDTADLLERLEEKLGLSNEKSEQGLWVVLGGKRVRKYIHNPLSKLTVGSLQIFLDEYIKANGCKIDYIHGADVLAKLSEEPNSIGFELETMRKEELFPAVVADGALPRKTFSMGHAYDKRYYLEAKKIVE